MSAVVDFPVKPEARPYLDAFVESASEPQWLRDTRRRGLARFAEAGFPSRRSEGWRYLDLQPLARHPMLPAAQGALSSVSPELGADLAWVRIVLLDGNCQLIVPRSPLPEGVWIAPMRRAISERPDLVRAAVGAGGVETPFGALGAALFADGFVVDIAAGAALDQPIEIVHFATSRGSIHTRSLVNLGQGSRATIVETYAGEGRYWRNDGVAARLANGAELTRICVIEEAGEAIHTALLDATLAAKASLTSFALLLGGNRVRQEWNARLAGEGAHCRLDGAYIVTGNDEANIVTAVEHAAPGGRTRELVKGVAAGRGHGAFQGRIVVREQAQQTDAHQLSRNLIIGRRAVIDTKPELEIYADDVKCAHGASVGDLDEAALFYLRARGIPAEEARRMLIDGFLREAVDGVDDFAVRTHLLRRLAARLATLEGAA
jgi:Fe-S cluster assembly protein SufD